MTIAIPLVVVTLFWALVGAGGPWLVPRGPNRGVTQTMIVMIAVCCYLFWLLAFMHQINPLIGPELNNFTAAYIAHDWGVVKN